MKQDKGLNEKQKAFCREYVKDFNITQAAARAGYSARSAHANGTRMMTNDGVQAEISRLVGEVLERDKVALEKKIFDYWMRRAFYDVTEIIDLDGKLKITDEELHERGLHVCIDSINTKKTAQGIESIKYEFANKDDAVEHLQKYIQMIRETVDFTGTINIISGKQDQNLK
ncbi:MAG: terminase small subunit [Spirochaetales bacterium]|jgi:phage terminase small subunit|nr:terminase small subunit [Spirochaetales bacterium]